MSVIYPKTSPRMNSKISSGLPLINKSNDHGTIQPRFNLSCLVVRITHIETGTAKRSTIESSTIISALAHKKEGEKWLICLDKQSTNETFEIKLCGYITEKKN